MMDYVIGKLFTIPPVSTAWTAISSVGWYIVAIAVPFCLAFPYLRQKYADWKLRKDEHDYAAKYHKNPDLLEERLVSVESARQRMQEEYRRKCTLKQEELREKVRRAKEAEEVSGHRLGTTSDNPSLPLERKSKSSREEYNPLMGDNSRGYRPPKRTCCGKGGCG